MEEFLARVIEVAIEVASCRTSLTFSSFPANGSCTMPAACVERISVGSSLCCFVLVRADNTVAYRAVLLNDVIPLKKVMSYIDLQT